MIKINSPKDKRSYWFKELIEFIKKSKYTESQKSILINNVAAYYFKEQQSGQKNIIFEEVNDTKNFFAYLSSVSEKTTFEFLNECVTASIGNKDGDFINNFVRYIVINNLEDTKVNCDLSSTNSKAGINVTATIGKYPLAKLELYESNDFIMFAGVEVNRNVRRLGIGTMLFKEVMEKVHEKHPEKDLLAHTVFKDNIEAIKFYESLGATMEESIFSHCYSARFKREKLAKVYQTKY